MKTRIISGLIMAPLLIIVYFGGWPLFFACLLLNLIALREFTQGMIACGVKPAYRLSCILTGILYCLHVIWPGFFAVKLMWVCLAVMASLVYGFKVEKVKMEDVTATVTGLMYITVLFYHVALIDWSTIPYMIWSVFLIAFGTDIFAYFTGTLIGKHKLCPKLSPKKSVEGAIGGIIGAMVLNGLFLYFVFPEYLLSGLIISAVGSVVSMLGDLSASMFKRHMGIKDYGKLIPGHGGILDRFDSVLFVAPVVYYYILFISGEIIIW